MKEQKRRTIQKKNFLKNCIFLMICLVLFFTSCTNKNIEVMPLNELINQNKSLEIKKPILFNKKQWELSVKDFEVINIQEIKKLGIEEIKPEIIAMRINKFDRLVICPDFCYIKCLHPTLCWCKCEGDELGTPDIPPIKKLKCGLFLNSSGTFDCAGDCEGNVMCIKVRIIYNSNSEGLACICL